MPRYTDNIPRTNYYTRKRELGEKYEDFINELFLTEFRIELTFYEDRESQFTGENEQGIEIKFDDRFSETGNLYIEYEERSRVEYNFSPSGIDKKDNSWLWAIGDYEVVYIFGKSQLLKLKKVCKHVQTDTSKGFLLPKELADEICLKRIQCPVKTP